LLKKAGFDKRNFGAVEGITTLSFYHRPLMTMNVRVRPKRLNSISRFKAGGFTAKRCSPSSVILLSAKSPRNFMIVAEALRFV
jgi:hypothetical protein